MAIAPGLLGLVKRRVGQLDGFGCTQRAALDEGNAETGCDRWQAGFLGGDCAHLIEYLVGDATCIFDRANIVGEDAEFVAADTAENVRGANRTLERSCEFAQDFITCSVTQRVVDGLEVINVEIEDGELAIVMQLALSLKRLLDGIDEREAAACAGELVDQGARLPRHLALPCARGCPTQ